MTKHAFSPMGLLQNQFLLVGAYLDFYMRSGGVSDHRVSVAHGAQRLTTAMGDLALIAQRLAKLEREDRLLSQLATERMDAAQIPPGQSPDRIDPPHAENRPSAPERMPRRRGGQPGNRNAFQHGRYSGETLAGRRRFRETLAESARNLAEGQAAYAEAMAQRQPATPGTPAVAVSKPAETVYDSGAENWIRPMPPYRSRTTTHGRNMAGARGLWRATGMKDSDFGKPIIAISNSFTQFVPGHVHLKDLGQMVAREIEASGGVAKEFNTIAVDDGIAMGHDGMLYSLPSRELIADSVEYMVNAHCADALVCISNCDKITPGMLMAALRLNIPTVFVSGGPMEAGKVILSTGAKKVDLIDAMVAAADENVSDEDVKIIERSACPTCGSCSGMFTANSMNCLTEAMGLSLPGNGSVLATHADRKELFLEAGRVIVKLAKRYYEGDDASVLPRSIASFKGFENAMTVDIAMGGSTNTVLHLLAAAEEAGVDFTMSDIDRLSRRVPCLCKVAPNKADVHMEDVHRAGGIMSILGELDRGGLIHTDLPTIHSATLKDALDTWDIARAPSDAVKHFYRAAPGGVPTQTAFSQDRRYDDVDADREHGVTRSVEHAFSQDGGLAVLFGNLAEDGCIVKTAGVDESILTFTGPARVFESQDAAVSAILTNEIKPGDVLVIRYEGPKGGPGMQEMLYPTSYLKSKGLGKACALITDGRFSGGTSGLSIGHASPEAAEGGAIGLVQDGDRIEIDIPNRTMRLAISDAELNARRSAMDKRADPWQPTAPRPRKISPALQAYAAMTTSAARGAVRDVTQLRKAPRQGPALSVEAAE